MSISLEKGRTRQILGALLIWMISAFVMALAADVLIGRLKLGSQCISIAAASILCLSSFAASLAMFHRASGGRGSFLGALIKKPGKKGTKVKKFVKVK